MSPQDAFNWVERELYLILSSEDRDSGTMNPRDDTTVQKCVRVPLQLHVHRMRAPFFKGNLTLDCGLTVPFLSPACLLSARLCLGKGWEGFEKFVLP